MKAIRINAPGEVEILELPMPERKPGKALLRVLYGGLCGSDLGSYRGTFAYFDYPRIPGHEFSAEIVEIDANDRGLKPGMTVTCNPYFNCGDCYSCRRGLVNACMDNKTMGCQMDGAFQEYITMPIERIYDGQGLSPVALAAIEPFCISYHGVQRARIQKGDKVLVVGGGTIGTFAAYAAQCLGGEVYLCDIPQAGEKLERNRSLFGFAGIIFNKGVSSMEEATRRLTGENQLHAPNGFDVCIEAVGLPETFQTCIDCAAFGGRVVLIGVGKKNLDFPFTLLQKKELNVYGSRNALPGDFKELIEMAKQGILAPEKIVSAVYPLEKAPEAFEAFHTNSSLLKVMIDFTK